MANTLKVITASASDTDGTGADLAADTDRILYKVPGSTTAIVVGFHVSNIVTNTIKITVTVNSDTTGVSTLFGVSGGNGTNGVNKPAFLVKDVAIPESSTIELLSGNKIFLQATDELKIQCDTVAGFNTIFSFVEQT